MPEALRISVAMCTYNGARHLSSQMQSFLDQARLPDEVVVCDDCSSDGTVGLLEEFALKAPFPVHIHRNEVNLGYSRNFIKAAGLCSGDVIALSDQDDLWYGHKLLRMEEVFRTHPEVGGIFSDGDLIDSSSCPLPGTLWESFDFLPEDQRRVVSGDAVSVLFRRNVVTGMAFAFRSCWRHVFDHMPDLWPHDFWLALMLAGEDRLMPYPERLVAYRVHREQQIGVPITRAEKIAFLRRNGVGAYLDLSRQRNLREYSKDALQFEALVVKAQREPVLEAAEWMPMARGKAAHMRRGVRLLEGGRMDRWLSVPRHWRSYRRYAPTGLSALIRDLLV